MKLLSVKIVKAVFLEQRNAEENPSLLETQAYWKPKLIGNPIGNPRLLETQAYSALATKCQKRSLGYLPVRMVVIGQPIPILTYVLQPALLLSCTLTGIWLYI